MRQATFALAVLLFCLLAESPVLAAGYTVDGGILKVPDFLSLPNVLDDQLIDDLLRSAADARMKAVLATMKSMSDDDLTIISAAADPCGSLKLDCLGQDSVSVKTIAERLLTQRSLTASTISNLIAGAALAFAVVPTVWRKWLQPVIARLWRSLFGMRPPTTR